MVLVREETPNDILAIRNINERAFGQPAEAQIVDNLRANCAGILSLVAVDGDQVVGHILFSPARIELGEKQVEGMGLAPLAALPERQRVGIGSALVQAGISMLKDRGCPFIIVLGYPGYYPRFGFERASLHGIRCQWEVPDEVFMILILDKSAMSEARGIARYRSEFDDAV
ncbi:MAG TPA: N-acetyltransferase [Methanotrichaceae archaeon]|nr:N-acetyltransferase [Methanotrichaceae archaeon]